MGWRVSALTYVKSKIITQYSQINPIRQLKDGELNYSTNHFCCESVLQKRISCTFSHKDNDFCKVRKSNYCIKGNHFCFSLSIYRLWTCAHFNSFFEGSDVYQLQKKIWVVNLLWKRNRARGSLIGRAVSCTAAGTACCCSPLHTQGQEFEYYFRHVRKL